MANANVTDTPTGFVCAMPWAVADRTLYVDVKANLASVRFNRNILSTRQAAKSQTNVALDQTFVLPANTGAPALFEHQAVPGNVMTIVSANRPVHIELTTPNGVLDLGLQTLFIITSSIVKLKFTNAEQKGDVEINLIIV